MLRDFSRAIRPEQWTKNLFCFSGLFFSGRALELGDVGVVAVYAFAFCLVSSAIYLTNDVKDKEADSRHASKRRRPVASGRISVRSALWGSGALLCVAFALVAALGKERSLEGGGILSAYIALNVAYTLKTKEIPILDVASIASGFVLRVIGGAMVIGIFPTGWLISSTFFLAMMLGFGKRLAETKAPVSTSRRVLERYRPGSLPPFVSLSRYLLLGCYCAYTVWGRDAPFLWVTVVPAFVGTSRYLQLIERGSVAESPEWILLNDRVVQTSLIVWGGLFFAVVYGERFRELILGRF